MKATKTIKIGPVSLDEFLGRKKELKRLEKIKKDYLKGYRRNIAIIGPLNIGKTSIIFKFIHQGLCDDLFPLYLNLEEGFLKESFLGFLLFFLRKSTKNDNKPLFADVAEVGKIIEEEYSALGLLVRNIETAQKNGNYKLLIDSVFRLPKIVKEITGKNCFFIIDEFFGFGEFKIDSWSHLLREHIMLDTHTLFVLLSSEKDKAKAMLNSELSLLFGNFELMELTNFSYQESLDFVAERMGKIEVNKEVLNYLILLSDGLPLYLDLLTNWVIENLKVLDWEGLIDALTENVLNNKGFLYGYFHEKLHLSPGMEKFQDFLPFMMEVARGNTKKKELKAMNVSYANYNYSMNGFLEKNGSFYRIKDPLFKIWVLYAYRSDLMGIKFDYPSRLAALTSEIKNLKTDFNSFRLKARPSEIVDFVIFMFQKFENEFIEICGKKKLLPKFSEVKKTVINEKYALLSAKKDKGSNWLIVVFTAKIDEVCVYRIFTEFNDKPKEFKQKVAVCVSDIDDNTKSILKTKGFWIWDLNMIRALGEFYNITGIFNAGYMD